MKTILFLAIAQAVVLSNKNLAVIQRIIHLVGEEKQKKSAELKQLVQDTIEHEKICGTDQVRYQHEIESAESEGATAEAKIQDAEATIDTNQEQIQEIARSIANEQNKIAMLKENKMTKSKQHQAYNKEMTETIATIESAIGLLSSKAVSKRSFAQVQKVMSRVQVGLSAIVKASAIQFANAKKLTALLENKDEDEDDEPAAPATMESIIQLLRDMKSESREQLLTERTAHSGFLHNTALEIQASIDMIKVLEKQQAQANAGLAGGKKSLASGTSAQSVAVQELNIAKKGLSDTELNCNMMAQQAADKKKKLSEVIAACEQAIEQLKQFGRPRSFLQVEKSSGSNRSIRTRIAEILQRAATKFHSMGLAQLAVHAQEDKFAKVRGMIEAMLDKLSQELQSAMDEHAWCKKEIDTQSTAVDELQLNFQKIKTTCESEKAELEVLQQKLETLTANMAESKDEVAEATALRNKENAEFKQNVDQSNIDIKALQDARTTLMEQNGDVFEQIVSIIQTVLQESQQALDQLNVDEEMAVKEFDSFSHNKDVEHAQMETNKKNWSKNASELEEDLGQHENEREEVQNQLSKMEDMLTQQKSQCAVKATSKEEEINKKRELIEALKEALLVLSGEEAAGGLAMLQKARHH